MAKVYIKDDVYGVGNTLRSYIKDSVYGVGNTLRYTLKTMFMG